MIPKFKRIVFQACPIEADRDYAEFASKFIAKGGQLLYESPEHDPNKIRRLMKEFGFEFDRTIAIHKGGRNYLTDVYVKL